MSLFKRGSKQRKIVPRADFLDGTIRYKKGQVYEVEIGIARYFERNGWLEGSDATAEAVKLAVDNSVLGHNGGM